MIRNFAELLNIVKKMPNKTIVIVAAHTESALDAAIKINDENIANCLLVGNEKKIRKYLSENKPKYKNIFEIINTKDDLQKAAKKSVQAVQDGKAGYCADGCQPWAGNGRL